MQESRSRSTDDGTGEAMDGWMGKQGNFKHSVEEACSGHRPPSTCGLHL